MGYLPGAARPIVEACRPASRGQAAQAAQQALRQCRVQVEEPEVCFRIIQQSGKDGPTGSGKGRGLGHLAKVRKDGRADDVGDGIRTTAPFLISLSAAGPSPRR